MVGTDSSHKFIHAIVSYLNFLSFFFTVVEQLLFGFGKSWRYVWLPSARSEALAGVGLIVDSLIFSVAVFGRLPISIILSPLVGSCRVPVGQFAHGHGFVGCLPVQVVLA